MDPKMSDNSSNPTVQFIELIYGTPKDFATGFKISLQKILTDEEDLVAAVYHARWELNHSTNGIMHVPGAEGSGLLKKNVKKHIYADAVSPGFVIPGHADFIPKTAAVVHTRSLAFLQMHLGEIFDLEDF
ncbi:hypothetical protein PENSUB_13466 [Penicillium subrubescens]|uniref:Uncharacterized protein n=1 Tax=Penicillium subrubescens TaxID=1316194 RepID=A0A1Q5SQV2_9EURO|nr:hypothetical protein PENSUB_13466 [Penicillium subrubescens]